MLFFGGWGLFKPLFFGVRLMYVYRPRLTDWTFFAWNFRIWPTLLTSVWRLWLRFWGWRRSSVCVSMSLFAFSSRRFSCFVLVELWIFSLLKCRCFHFLKSKILKCTTDRTIISISNGFRDEKSTTDIQFADRKTDTRTTWNRRFSKRNIEFPRHDRAG